MGCVGAVGAHAYDLQSLVHPTADLIGGDTQIFRRKGHVLLHHVGDDLVIWVLKHHPHRAPHFQPLLVPAGVHAIDVDCAAAGQENGIHVLGQRGLAAAVVPQDGHKGASLDFQGNVLEDLDGLAFFLIVLEGDVVKLNDVVVFLHICCVHPFRFLFYYRSAIQRPVAPQGSARPEAVTGRPSS